MAEQELEGLNAPPVEETPPPEVPAPVAAAPPEPVKPAEDVEGIKGALVAERRRRQELEQEIQQFRTPPPKPAEIPDVPDAEAEQYARQYELYTPSGLDVNRAKRMIADNNARTERIARQAAEQAIEPLKQTTHTQASRQNFVWAASQTDAEGQPLVDPRVLADVWASMPAELTAQAGVAQVVLKTVVGESFIARRPRPKAPEREPVISESPGGFRPSGYTISNVEKKVAASVGVKEADWEKSAKTYQPGQPNRLE